MRTALSLTLAIVLAAAALPAAAEGEFMTGKTLKAGLEGWVAQRTAGAVEMADALCEAPGARTLDDLVALIERIGRKPAKTPAA